MSRGDVGRFVGAALLSTLTLDLGSAVLRKARLAAGVPPEAFAKWFGHLYRGTFVHDNVLQAPAVKGGLAMALVSHYVIGAILTGAFWLLLQQLSDKTLGIPALAALAISFGLLTSVFPWLLMFPSMGFGLFGKDGPAELMLFRSSLLNHFWFGVGLFWTALVLMPKR